MQYVQLDAYGGPEVLRVVDGPDPVPGPGTVLVTVTAAGITFIETQMRAGRSPRPGPPPDPPLVLGNGVEGSITAVGVGVDPALVGRRVVTATGGLGGYASQVVVPAADPIAIPPALAPGHAVALLADGRTALGLIRAAALTPSDRVLVTAAAGGVGSLLVQLARAAGAARIVALAGGGRKGDLARSLGADVAVDYRAPGWAGGLEPVDVAFDGVGGEVGRLVLELVAPGGRFLPYGAAGGAMTDTAGAGERGVTVIPGYRVVTSPADNRALVEQALAEAAAGRLTPVIGQTYPLAEAAAAHAAIESRATVGKTLLITPAG
jgi:NADPH2:quinone reductase